MKNEFRQAVRLATPGELRAYVVYEHQLDAIGEGQPATLMLNFALFFLGVAATGFGTVAALPTEQIKAYYTFLIISLITLIAGIVLLSLWFTLRRPVVDMIAEIKRQMPPNPAVDQASASNVMPGGSELHSSSGG